MSSAVPSTATHCQPDARDHRQARPLPEVRELARSADRDEADAAGAADRVLEDPRVHHRRLDGAVGPERRDHAEPAILGGDPGEVGELGHRAMLAPGVTRRQPFGIPQGPVLTCD